MQLGYIFEKKKEVRFGERILPLSSKIEIWIWIKGDRECTVLK